MPLRIALIGTSHAAAFKAAWDTAAQDWPRVEITFFAARNTGSVEITQLVPDYGKLVARAPDLADRLRATSGGLSEIDPAAYDAILLVGFPPRPVLLPPLSPYSAAVRAALYQSARAASTLAEMTTNLRSVAPDIPVFVAAQPYAATPPKGAQPEARGYLAAAAAMEREVYGPLGVRFLPQPAATLIADRWTDPMFSRGSLRLPTRPGAKSGAPHPAADRAHMNAAYGALALAEALPVITAAVSG